MIAEVKSGMIIGIHGFMVTVQSDISDGLPLFHMIGYLSSEVKEAKERVKTAMKNTGFSLPAKRIAVNLAPADIRKSGVFFDAAIAVSLFISMGKILPDAVKDMIILGELSLDGRLLPVRGILPIILSASESGITRCIVPEKNVTEASLPGRMKVYGCESLTELFELLSGKIREPFHLDRNALFRMQNKDNLFMDFSEIKGQPLAKRAMEIAVSGFHNVLLEGPPGAGKSMLASSLPGILPEMNWKEMLETTVIQSARGILSEQELISKKRPYRAPSAGITKAGMFGGGRNPRPGEISLAHHGV